MEMEKGNLLKNQRYMNYWATFFGWKFKIYFHDFFEFLSRVTFHSSSSTIYSYGEYRFSTSMEIYHESSEGPYYLPICRKLCEKWTHVWVER